MSEQELDFDQPIAHTVLGTPVYYATDLPDDCLAECHPFIYPPSKGALAQYLFGLQETPACFIVKVKPRYMRLFKVDSDGSVVSILVDSIIREDRIRLEKNKILSKTAGVRKRR
jgi:hypothetical protein